MLKRERRRTAAVGLCIAVGLAACRSEAPEPSRPSPSSPSERPNIVLVTIDTLRADHCSLYGYERKTTPFIDAIALRSLVFENAYSTSSWTSPSIASLFTSLPPRSHGVIRGFLRGPKPAPEHDILAPEFVTLPEMLKSHGYRTLGVTTNIHVSRATGFGQGFDELREVSWQAADVANREALALKPALEEPGPYFLWLHYVDPHDPYLGRPPWIRQFSAGTKGHLEWARRGMPAIRKGFAQFRDDPELLAGLVSLYDSEVAYTDAALRDVFSQLEIDSESLVIITSDHGEAFTEHGTMGHGTSLFEEQIRIPLVVRLPRGEGTQRVTTPVSLLDVYPTVLEVAGIEAPERLAGTSLLAIARGEADQARPIAAELARNQKTIHSLRSGRWKLYAQISPRRHTGLYDLATDPGENQDLGADDPRRLAELEAAWTRWTKQWHLFVAPTVPSQMTPEQLERLRALGY